jgi:hypothetical protein
LAGRQILEMMTLRNYIDYLDASEGPSPGFWIDPATKFSCDEPPELAASPLYLSKWRTFSRHPELLYGFHASSSVSSNTQFTDWGSKLEILSSHNNGPAWGQMENEVKKYLINCGLDKSGQHYSPLIKELESLVLGD